MPMPMPMTLQFNSHFNLNVFKFFFPCVIIQKSDLLNASIYDIIYEKDHQEVHKLLSNPVNVIDPMKNDLTMGKVDS